jgi:hypothetical protein
VKALGIQNMFDVETSNPDKPFFMRNFPLLFYFWKQGALSADQMKYVFQKEIMDDPDLFAVWSNMNLS